MQKTNPLTRLYRITRIILHTIVGISIAATSWPFLSQNTKTNLTKWWCKGLLNCFNFQVKVFGNQPESNTTKTLFLANHITWSDIHALNSIIPLRFIAKSEINTWPIFGYLARTSGTIFINRSNRKDAARIVDTAAKHLTDGDNIGFFPEGTTTNGTLLAPFKSSIVQAAINAKADILPIAIKYPYPNGQVNTLVAYAGDTSLGESFMNILKQKQPIVELHFLTSINAKTASRQALTKTAFDTISAALNL